MKELSSLRAKETLEWKKTLSPSGGEFQKWQLKGKSFTEMTSKKGRPSDCSTTIEGWWRQKLHKWCEGSWKMRCGRPSRRLKSCSVWNWEVKRKQGSEYKGLSKRLLSVKILWQLRQAGLRIWDVRVILICITQKLKLFHWKLVPDVHENSNNAFRYVTHR